MGRLGSMRLFVSLGLGAVAACSDDVVATCEPYTVEGDLVVDDDTDPTSTECLTEITGNLVVEDTNGLTNLVLLEDLERVGGEIRIIGNQGLTSLEGLERLQSVTAHIWIVDNPQLATIPSLTGLESLDYLVVADNPALVEIAAFGPSLFGLRGVTVHNNDALVDLSAFVSVTEIDEAASITIADNDSLRDVSGLGAMLAGSHAESSLDIYGNVALDNIAGLETTTELEVLTIAGNPTLAGLEGLTGLTRAEEVVIRGNSELGDLTGLSGLTTVTSLTIGGCITELADPVQNAALIDLHGLEQLTSVDYLKVGGNPMLSSLTALAGLTGAVLQAVTINQNSSLSPAEIDAFLSSISVAGVIETCENMDEMLACECAPE